MTIFEEIYDLLAEMKRRGITQQEIANNSGVSRPYICQLMNPKDGVERIKHLELSKLLKLFPDVRIVFGGDRRIGDVHHNTNSPVIQGDGNTIGTPGEETAAAFLRRVMASDDIEAETKVKIFNLYSRR